MGPLQYTIWKSLFQDISPGNFPFPTLPMFPFAEAQTGSRHRRLDSRQEAEAGLIINARLFVLFYERFHFVKS